MSKKPIIDKVFEGGGHIVLLGAGASIASTLRNPEKGNKILPSMDNLIEVIGLQDIVDSLPKRFQEKNFETFYSKLSMENNFTSTLAEIETKVYAYFADMVLPDEPTIYDYLVLSLRPKDIIASFNWDPFLHQAWVRHKGFADLPYLAFLHGNVAVGYSKISKRFGPIETTPEKSFDMLEPTKLLFPITQKNYSQDEFLVRQWAMFKSFLEDKGVRRMTIFGYSAPDSDTEAVKTLSESWLLNNVRDVEELEIIDVQPQKEITSRWKNFIPSRYYSYSTNFFNSVIAHQPRRTSESFFLHYFPKNEEEAWTEPNPVPQNFQTLDEMRNWYKPLVDAENKIKLKK